MWGYVTLEFNSAGSARSSRAQWRSRAIAELERTADKADGVAGRDVAQRNAAERQPREPSGQAPPAPAAWGVPENRWSDSGAERQLRAQGERRAVYKVTFNELWARLAVLRRHAWPVGGDGCGEYDRILEAT